MIETDKILFQEHKKKDGSFLGEIKLNNPKKFNALDLDIILSLKNQLIKWKEDPKISLIFIHGEGEKAFCAGGDVKSLYHSILDFKEKGDDPGLCVQEFFEQEYRADYLMHTYPKPIVLWGQGIVMGGGLGLFMAASHSIVTETSMLAMPEITIGLFPDVGGSYFLNSIKKHFGLYLALTACRLNGTEALFLKISKLSFKNSQKQSLFEFLLNSSFKDLESFDLLLSDFHSRESLSLEQENWLQSHEKEIFNLLESEDIYAIYENFKNSDVDDKKWQKNKDHFLKGSPSSAGLICEQLKRGEGMSLKEVFKMELVMAMQCARHGDFQEGVRALLVDKTNDPQWVPESIKDLKKTWVLEHFQALSDWTNPLENL